MRKFGIWLAFVCAVPALSQAQTFEHALEGTKTPWTHTDFDTAPDKFMFAIHADLSGGERTGVFQTAMTQLSLLRPEFLISIGDLIEGGGDRFDLMVEWDSYDARVKDVGFPVMYVGGNHDVSSDIEREVWAERYGPLYYHFVYRDTLFLVLDSEDTSPKRRAELVQLRLEAIEIHKTEGAEAALATPYGLSTEKLTGAIGDAQADYFVDVLAQYPDVQHTFLFVHKPVWEAEDGPYFRIDEALKGRDFTAFNGHVHAYGYSQRHGQDHIQLATTGGGFFPDLGMSRDHVTLVTVSDDRVDIANLMMDGIRGKSGDIPGDGESQCFTPATCEEQQ